MKLIQNLRIHKPFYTTRLLNLPEPVNLTDLSLFQYKSDEFIIINIL